MCDFGAQHLSLECIVFVRAAVFGALRFAMRNRWGQLVAPLPLRIVLGLTFLWAGLSKIEGEFLVQGDTAATLASMGVDRLREEGQRNLRAVPPTQPVAQPVPQPAQSPSATPPASQPGQQPTQQPNPQPSQQPSQQPSPVGPPVPEAPSLAPPVGPAPTPDQPSPEVPKPEQSKPQQNTPDQGKRDQAGSKPEQRAEREDSQRAFPVLAQGLVPHGFLAQVTAPPSPSDANTSAKAEILYHAGMFPQPVSIKRLYGVSLLMYRAGNPPPRASASAAASPNSSPVTLTPNEPSKLLPSFLTKGTRPLAFAWMLAIGEVIAGVLLLIGLLTRVAATWCALVMIGAIWLTELGPAVQAGNALFGFLPQRNMWEPELWKSLFWQVSMLGCSLSLAFMGSGSLGLDKRLFPDTPPSPSRPRPMM